MKKSKEAKRINLAPGALTAPLPPALVTVGDGERTNVLTVAWTGILSTVPPRTYISVRPSRHSYGILKETGEFVINLASADMAREVDFAGIYTGKKMDKFERCGFTAVPSEKVLAPTLAECPLSIECKVFDVIEMGSHDVFMADIVSVSCREELMSGDGRLMLDAANLLAYAHGEYFSLGEKLGKFGFSTDKSKARDSAEKRNAVREGKSGGFGENKKSFGEPTFGEDKRGKSGAMVANGKSKAGARTEREQGRGSARVGREDALVPLRKAVREGKAPFYMGMPKGKAKRSPEGMRDKGKPHGRKRAKGGDGK